MIAGAQGGQFHGNAVPVHGIGCPGSGLAHRLDGFQIGCQVARGPGFRERRLTQHVEGVAVCPVVCLVAALYRLADGAPQHELVGNDAHGGADGGPQHRHVHLRQQFSGKGPRGLCPAGLQADQLAGEHQGPGGGIDEQGIGGTQVLLPVGTGQPVLDQGIPGVGIGNAQQRFRKAHQHHPFPGGKIVVLHEGGDAGLVLLLRPQMGDQIGAQRSDCLLMVAVGLGQEGLDHQGLIGQIQCIDVFPAGNGTGGVKQPLEAWQGHGDELPERCNRGLILHRAGRRVRQALPRCLQYRPSRTGFTFRPAQGRDPA